MPNPLVLQHAPWSLSKAQAALNCSFKYHHTYVKKRKGVKPVRSDGEIGSAVHKALEMALKTPGANITEILRQVAVSSRLTTTEIEDLISYAHNIQNFLKRIDEFSKKNHIEKTLIEHKFGFTVDGAPTTFFGGDVFFRGMWDLALLTRSKHLVVIDHKTGTPSDITKYKDQLDAYAVSAFFTVPELQGVQAAIHYVGTEDIFWAKMVPRATIQDQLVPWLFNFLDRAANATVTPTPVQSWLCDFCEHMDVCPLKNRP
jgi:hypothetical protein